MRLDAHQKRPEARRQYNLLPLVAIRWVLVEEDGINEVYVGAVGKPSKTGPSPGTGEELVHIPPVNGALDGGSQVKAVTWPVIAIPKKTSFTSEEEATSALEQLRLAEMKGKGEVIVEEKDVANYPSTPRVTWGCTEQRNMFQRRVGHIWRSNPRKPWLWWMHQL